MAKKVHRKVRKREKMFTSDVVITYLERENKYLREELSKMADLCKKLASADAVVSSIPPRIESTQPTNLIQGTTACKPSQPSNESFVLPRRSAKFLTPPMNSWESNIVLNNSFSALSMESEENGEGRERDNSG